jgi:hypothetical protein
MTGFDPGDGRWGYGPRKKPRRTIPYVTRDGRRELDLDRVDQLLTEGSGVHAYAQEAIDRARAFAEAYELETGEKPRYLGETKGLETAEEVFHRRQRERERAAERAEDAERRREAEARREQYELELREHRERRALLGLEARFLVP